MKETGTCCGGASRVHRVLAVVGEGFEEVELAMYTDLAGWTRLLGGMPAVEIVVGGFREVIRSKHGLRIMRDVSLDEAATRDWEALYIPGGWPDAGHEEIYREPVPSLIRRVHASGGVIATNCTGIFAVGEAGLLRGRRATTYVSPGGCGHCARNGERLAAYGAIHTDGPIVVDDRIFSDIGPAVGIPAALAFFKTFVGESGVARIERELRGADRASSHV